MRSLLTATMLSGRWGFRLAISCALTSSYACSSKHEQTQVRGAPDPEPTSSDSDTTGTAVPPCKEDKECSTDFCDLGICADPKERAAQTPQYGKTCDPEGSFKTCQSYVCLDNRCRSCRGDFDCSVSAECLIYPDIPGRQCGAPGSGMKPPDPLDD